MPHKAEKEASLKNQLLRAIKKNTGTNAKYNGGNILSQAEFSFKENIYSPKKQIDPSAHPLKIHLKKHLNLILKKGAPLGVKTSQGALIYMMGEEIFLLCCYILIFIGVLQVFFYFFIKLILNKLSSNH